MMAYAVAANVCTPPRAHAARRQVQELPPPLNDAPALILPRLKHLELVAVCFSNCDMERLLVDQWVEYLPHHLHDSPDYLCVLLVRQEDITRCVPWYGH